MLPMLPLLFAFAAALAFTGVYLVSENPVRQTLRFAGGIAFWTLCLTLIIHWS